MRPPETVYRGVRIIERTKIVGVRVTVDCHSLSLARSQAIHNHSGGFEWGYIGASPMQLALAIVLDATGNEQLALRTHRYFMWGFLAQRLRDEWTITAREVRDWVEQAEREQSPPTEEVWEDEDAVADGVTSGEQQGLQQMIATVSAHPPLPAEYVPRCEPIRRCRECGCTEDDCRQCIVATGEPCHWVAADLCSRCERDVWIRAMFAPGEQSKGGAA